MKNILVTGGAGFIGSNFVKYMLDKYPDYKIINVDALTYAGNLENLKDIAANPNYIFIKADIRDRDKIDGVFAAYDIGAVVNMAAESLIKYVKDRPGHDRRYAIDNRKITTQLGWEPAYTFEQGMQETIAWYLANMSWVENIVSGDYVGYYGEMYGAADEVAAAKFPTK